MGIGASAGIVERREWIVAGAVSAIVALVARLAISWGRREYAIWPDEPAQLAIARYVGGGTRWNMHNHSVWRPLFGTLVSPVYRFTDDPTTVLRTALVLNALLGAVAAWLLVLLARRLTPMPAPWCAVAAVLISLSPAVLFTSDFVFSESLVLPLYLGTVLFLVRLHATPSLANGVGAGLLAAAAFGTHSRMLPLTFIVVGVAIAVALQHRLPVRDAFATGTVAVASAFSMSVYTSVLVDRSWNEPSTRNSAGGVLDQATNLPALAVSAIGQTWSLLVASLGLVAYGAVALVRIVARPTTRSTGRSDASRPPRRGDAAVVLLVAGSCTALSVVFMSDRWRSDQLVYGRYNAVAVTPLLLVGFAVLIGAIRQHRFALVVLATAAATAITGAVLWFLRHDLLGDSNGLEPMILGLQPFVTSATALEVPFITVLAVVATLALGGVAIAVRDQRRRARSAAVLLAVLLVIGSVRTGSTLDRLWDDSGDASAVESLREGALGDGVAVDYFLPAGSNSTVPMMLYQFHLPRTAFTVVSDPLAGASAYVFAPTDDTALLDAGARLIWSDPRRPIGLWQR